MNKENLFKALDEGTIDEITDLLYEDFESTVRVLKQLKNELTPPTADEVCKALSEYYELKEDESVFYRSNTKEFVIDTSMVGFEDEICIMLPNFTIAFYHDLPPHLITMIGRFYEGEIE